MVAGRLRWVLYDWTPPVPMCSSSEQDALCSIASLSQSCNGKLWKMDTIATRAVIHMQLCQHVIDMRKSCGCQHKKYFMRKSCQCQRKKYFTTYIDMLFQSNSTQKYLRNNKIRSNFSRDKTIVAFCQPSFILWLQCALYFRVCSISRLFLCPMNINESVI